MNIQVYMFFVRNNLIINLKDNLKFITFDQLRTLIKYAKINNYKCSDMLLNYYKKRYIYFLRYNDNAKHGINCRHVIKYIFNLADSPVR